MKRPGWVRLMGIAAVAVLLAAALAASSGRAATAATAKPLSGITVGIDPGHNGRDHPLPGPVTDLRNLPIRYGPATTDA
jgi:N-acetylmuramoyl-L-alanine amidase